MKDDEPLPRSWLADYLAGSAWTRWRRRSLTTLSLPALTHADWELQVHDNAQLPTSQANTLRNQLADYEGKTTITDNAPQ